MADEYIIDISDSEDIVANLSDDAYVVESQSGIISYSYPEYSGPFTIIASKIADVVIAVGQKTVLSNIIVSKIKSHSRTVSPAISQQTVTPGSGYDFLDEVIVEAMPTGTAGTPVATKGSVSGNAVSVTPSVSNAAGYIGSGTISGAPVSVSASELVSGNKSITATTSTQNNIDVINYQTVSVSPTPTETKTVSTNGTYSPASGKHFSQVTVSIPEEAGKTVTPTTSEQTAVQSGKLTTGDIKVGAIQTETNTFTSNGTYTPSAGKYFSSVTVNVQSAAIESNKNVSPTTSQQIVTPSSGYSAMAQVTVAAIQTETKTVTANGTYTPTSGKYISQVTVNIPTYDGSVS